MDQGMNAQDSELKEVEENLLDYRGYLLALNKVFEWEPPYVPGIVILAVTIIFSITWYVEPTVLTLVSLIGILVCLLDHVALFASNQFYKQPEQWREVEEIHYRRVCERLLNGKHHVKLLWNKLYKLKIDKPNTFVVTIVGTFLTLAWIGSFIDTLLLVYLIVVIATLIPGLRKHGLLQKAFEFLRSKLRKPKSQ